MGGNLSFDIAHLLAGSLVLIMAGITVWIVRKAFSAPEPDAIKRPEE